MHGWLAYHMADVYLHIMIMMIVVISMMTVYTEKHLLDAALL